LHLPMLVAAIGARSSRGDPVWHHFHERGLICSAHSVSGVPVADAATARGCARHSRGRRGCPGLSAWWFIPGMAGSFACVRLTPQSPSARPCYRHVARRSRRCHAAS
jgi:hypothetical protein